MFFVGVSDKYGCLVRRLRLHRNYIADSRVPSCYGAVRVGTVVLLCCWAGFGWGAKAVVVCYVLLCYARPSLAREVISRTLSATRIPNYLPHTCVCVAVRLVGARMTGN